MKLATYISTYEHVRAYMYTYIHMYILVHTYIHTCTHAHTYIHTYIHTYTRARMHTHTQYLLQSTYAELYGEKKVICQFFKLKKLSFAIIIHDKSRPLVVLTRRALECPHN